VVYKIQNVSHLKQNSNLSPIMRESLDAVPVSDTDTGLRVGIPVMDNGWIKLHRKIQDHWLWEDPVKLKWWIDILLTVNHKPVKINIGYDLIECDRGQSIMSLSRWAERWKVSRHTVRNFFDLCAKDGMISRKVYSKTTQITVCNYDDYQLTLRNEGQMKDKLRTDEGQMRDTNKKDKNSKNIKEKEINKEKEGQH